MTPERENVRVKTEESPRRMKGTGGKNFRSIGGWSRSSRKSHAKS